MNPAKPVRSPSAAAASAASASRSRAWAPSDRPVPLSSQAKAAMPAAFDGCASWQRPTAPTSSEPRTGTTSGMGSRPGGTGRTPRGSGPCEAKRTSAAGAGTRLAPSPPTTSDPPAGGGKATSTRRGPAPSHPLAPRSAPSSSRTRAASPSWNTSLRRCDPERVTAGTRPSAGRRAPGRGSPAGSSAGHRSRAPRRRRPRRGAAPPAHAAVAPWRSRPHTPLGPLRSPARAPFSCP